MLFLYEHTIFKQYYERQYRFNQFFIPSFNKEIFINNLVLQMDLKETCGSSEDFSLTSTAILDYYIKKFDFASLLIFGVRGPWQSTRDVQAELDLKHKKNYKLRKKKLNFIYSTIKFFNMKNITFFINTVCFSSRKVAKINNLKFFNDFFYINSSTIEVTKQRREEMQQHKSIYNKFLKIKSNVLKNKLVSIKLNVPLNIFPVIKNVNKYYSLSYTKNFYYKTFINLENFSPNIFGILNSKRSVRFYWVKILLQGLNILIFEPKRN